MSRRDLPLWSLCCVALISFGLPSSSGRWQNVEELHVEGSLPLMSFLLTNTITNTLSLTCSDIESTDFSNIPTALFPSDTTVMEYGIPSESELILHINSVITEPISETNYVVSNVQIQNHTGLPQGLQVSYPEDALAPETQTCIPLIGVPEETGLFSLELSCSVVISIFGNLFTLNNYIFSHWIRIVPNISGIPGCLYSFAGNYNPLATFDDGSCVEQGCTNPEALNYSSTAVFDDGTCVFCDGSGGSIVCPADVNGDGFVGTPDLLQLLGSFGAACE